MTRDGGEGEDLVVLTVPEASVLKAAAQAWMAGCNRSIMSGGHGACSGHAALGAVVDKVRARFEVIVQTRRTPSQGDAAGAGGQG